MTLITPKAATGHHVSCDLGACFLPYTSDKKIGVVTVADRFQLIHSTFPNQPKLLPKSYDLFLFAVFTNYLTENLLGFFTDA